MKTTSRRRFDVTMTLFLRRVSAGIRMGNLPCNHQIGPVCGFNINISRPRQNGRHFTDGIFKCIFLNENACISINISLKFIPGRQMINIPTLVQMMAWCRPGDKPLSKPLMANLLTHIRVTRPRWFKRPSYQRRNSHFTDKTIVRLSYFIMEIHTHRKVVYMEKVRYTVDMKPCYLYNGNPYTRKYGSQWNRPIKPGVVWSGEYTKDGFWDKIALQILMLPYYNLDTDAPWHECRINPHCSTPWSVWWHPKSSDILIAAQRN